MLQCRVDKIVPNSSVGLLVCQTLNCIMTIYYIERKLLWGAHDGGSQKRFTQLPLIEMDKQLHHALHKVSERKLPWVDSEKSRQFA